MTEDLTNTMSAFLDGESVDPNQLAAALEVPDARAALVDFVRMRAAVRAGDQPLPPSLAAFRRPPAAGLRLLRWSAVAALFALVFLAGLVAPRPWTSTGERGDAPPAPSRVEKFVPGVDWHQSN